MFYAWANHFHRPRPMFKRNFLSFNLLLSKKPRYAKGRLKFGFCSTRWFPFHLQLRYSRYTLQESGWIRQLDAELIKYRWTKRKKKGWEPIKTESCNHVAGAIKDLVKHEALPNQLYLMEWRKDTLYKYFRYTLGVNLQNIWNSPSGKWSIEYERCKNA